MRISRLSFLLCSAVTMFGQMKHIYPLPDGRNVAIRKDVVYANAGRVLDFEPGLRAQEPHPFACAADGRQLSTSLEHQIVM